MRLQELQTGAESQDSQSMQQVAAMEFDIEIHACQLRSMFMFFFPGQPLKDDVGKCVEAALKKYDEQKNVVWISLR